MNCSMKASMYIWQEVWCAATVQTPELSTPVAGQLPNNRSGGQVLTSCWHQWSDWSWSSRASPRWSSGVYVGSKHVAAVWTVRATAVTWCALLVRLTRDTRDTSSLTEESATLIWKPPNNTTNLSSLSSGATSIEFVWLERLVAGRKWPLHSDKGW